MANAPASHIAHLGVHKVQRAAENENRHCNYQSACFAADQLENHESGDDQFPPPPRYSTCADGVYLPNQACYQLADFESITGNRLNRIGRSKNLLFS